MSILQLPLHPFLSVTSTLWDPLLKLTAVCVVSPSSHLKVYGDVPPAGVTVAEPLFVKQSVFLTNVTPQVTNVTVVVLEQGGGSCNELYLPVIVNVTV